MTQVASQPKLKRAVPAWHKPFLVLLPTIESYAKAAFGYLDPDAREEAVAEAIAHAMVAITGLVARRKDPTGFPVRIAQFAVLRVRAGRLFAGQNAHDVHSSIARQQAGFEVRSLDDESCDPDTGWKAAACQDTRSWPVPDAVAFRVDFDHWLKGLPRRDRHISERLLAGDRPGEVARKFKVSPSRISQLRRELRESWERLGSTDVAAESAVAAA